MCFVCAFPEELVRLCFCFARGVIPEGLGSCFVLLFFLFVLLLDWIRVKVVSSLGSVRLSEISEVSSKMNFAVFIGSGRVVSGSVCVNGLENVVSA